MGFLMPSALIREGSFVEVVAEPYATWGVGKLTGISGGMARIQYFDAPGAKQPKAVECPLSQVRRVVLPAQTRVYRRHAAGRWQVGRVLECEGDTVFVQFPNKEYANVEAALLQVRWRCPLTDPLQLLGAEATETPFLADARSEFVRQVARQRTSSAGITALLCSSIDLVDYQFETVRRVLTDPVQRYLLADEVGLGKTIEAGVVIRQFFLDHPEKACAVVVVPTTLVQQWRSELSVRFGLAGQLDHCLHIVGHENLSALATVLDASVGLLVVDEAHHLSRNGNAAQERLYEMLRACSRKTPRLLLLSATPVLGDEEGFLRVLHLLDPVVFPLTDVDGLRRRIASRQVVAEVVAMLTPENLWGLRPELDRLEEAYSDDILLMEKVAALREVLNTYPNEEDEAYLAALSDLRSHLLESYRLHRRLLRNRRAAVPWATPRRCGLTVTPFSSRGAKRRHESLEQLRLHLNGIAEPLPQIAMDLMCAAVQTHYPTSLRQLLSEAGVADTDALMLAQEADVAGERLRAESARFDALVALVQRLVEKAGVQVVVFCDQAADANRAEQSLSQALPGLVARHESGAVVADANEPCDTGATWRRFLTAPEQVRVLVCDARAEEGVNLHGGKKIAVHFDLPLAPNRVEQRLGRLDRYGTGDPIPSHVLIDEDMPDEAAWLKVVDSGWGVFDRSVASLQYLIESASRPLAGEWMGQGTQALIDHSERLAGPDGMVQRELQQLDHQDALDALGEVPETALDEIEDCDGEWQSWRDAFKHFAVEVLSFEQLFEGSSASSLPGADPVFRMSYVLPDRGRPTLIPLSAYLRCFLQSVDRSHSNSRTPVSHRYVFRRQNAVSHAASGQEVYPLRVGDALVTALEQFCQQDDRGRAFAVWRVDRQHEVSNPCGADLFFRFDFIVRPELSQLELDAALDVSALARKAGVLMPPLALRIWVDGSGTILDEPPQVLTARYSDVWNGSRRDFNLNPRRWRQMPLDVQSAWMRDWPELCEQRRADAQAAVLDSQQYRSHVEKALKACAEEARLRRTQGASRLVRLAGAAREQEEEELERDDGMYQQLEQVLSQPVLDLDVVGAMFVAADNPFEA